jgi:nitrate/nitrite transport system substrate-binding protein
MEILQGIADMNKAKTEIIKGSTGVLAVEPQGNSRRDFMMQTSAILGSAGVLSMVPMSTRAAVWAGGSDAPEKPDLNIGFIPLTDCASVVMAHELGLYKKFGLNVTLFREASWAALRDKLVMGKLDAVHVLYGLMYGTHLGIGSPKKSMAILMGLNRNGQAITLSKQLRDKGATGGEALHKLVMSTRDKLTFAHTFPTGTHAMWLYYWLAAHGINPVSDVKNIVLPPSQMVANMRNGNIDGFCAGEPWNARAQFDKVGFTATTSQAIWKDHPEKVFGTTSEFTERYPNTTRALMRAVLEASQHIDTMVNRAGVSRIIAGRFFVDASEQIIAGRMSGNYEDGLGKTWQDQNYMKFHDDGQVNFPYYSDGVWFLTQFRRWGLLKEDIDYLAVARQVNQVQLYTEVAKEMGMSVPDSAMKTERLFDGVVFDPGKAAEYVGNFKIYA